MRHPEFPESGEDIAFQSVPLAAGARFYHVDIYGVHPDSYPEFTFIASNAGGCGLWFVDDGHGLRATGEWQNINLLASLLDQAGYVNSQPDPELATNR